MNGPVSTREFRVKWRPRVSMRHHDISGGVKSRISRGNKVEAIEYHDQLPKVIDAGRLDKLLVGPLTSRKGDRDAHLIRGHGFVIVSGSGGAARAIGVTLAVGI